MTVRAMLLAAAGLAAAWLATLWLDPFADERITDVLVYLRYGDLFLAGELPYRDVPFEYPPLAAPLMALGGVAGTDYETYRAIFAAITLVPALVVVLGCGALARATGGDYRLALAAAALAPLLTGAMIRTHFDLAPVALTVLALLAIVRGRVTWGFALLALGAMTKAFPLVVAPVALAWLLARGERRYALHGMLALLGTLAVVAAAALAISPSGFADAVRYQVDRPVQVESAPAVVLRAVEALGGADARAVHSHGSDGLDHPADGLVSGLFMALLAATIALLAFGATRGERPGTPPGPRSLVLASLGAVIATAAFASVLSPQFLIWTVPLLALACAWRMRALAATLSAALVLTQIEFPSRYFDLVDREPFPVELVAVRDLVLIAAVGLVVLALLGPRRQLSTAAARST